RRDLETICRISKERLEQPGCNSDAERAAAFRQILEQPDPHLRLDPVLRLCLRFEEFGDQIDYLDDVLGVGWESYGESSDTYEAVLGSYLPEHLTLADASAASDYRRDFNRTAANDWARFLGSLASGKLAA